MATRAILRTNGAVVKYGVGKVFRIVMAGGAGTSKVIGWWSVAAGAILVTCQVVIEGN